MGKTVEKPVAAKPAKPPLDIGVARKRLNAAAKAYEVVEKKRLRALVRLNAAQVAVDESVAAIKSGAPVGSVWRRYPNGGIVSAFDAQVAANAFDEARRRGLLVRGS